MHLNHYTVSKLLSSTSFSHYSLIISCKYLVNQTSRRGILLKSVWPVTNLLQKSTWKWQRCLQDPTVPEGYVPGSTFPLPVIPAICNEKVVLLKAHSIWLLSSGISTKVLCRKRWKNADYMVPTVPLIRVSIYMVWQEKLGCHILGFIVHTYQVCSTGEI